MTGPSHSIEVERSYDVDATTALPDWSALPGVSTVGAAEVRELDARYFDTAELTLGRARVAVRRRTGGPDEGWHVKAAAAEGRHEWHWPIEAGDVDAVPDVVADAVAQWARPPFAPLARIRNTRTAYALRDAAGRLVAEVADDRVRALAERTGAVQEWREWEVELGEAAPADADAFFRAVDALVAVAGARPAASDSKLARTLGL